MELKAQYLLTAGEFNKNGHCYTSEAIDAMLAKLKEIAKPITVILGRPAVNNGNISLPMDKFLGTADNFTRIANDVFIDVTLTERGEKQLQVLRTKERPLAEEFDFRVAGYAHVGKNNIEMTRYEICQFDLAAIMVVPAGDGA